MKTITIGSCVVGLSLALAHATQAQDVRWLKHYGSAQGYSTGIALAYDEAGYLYGTGTIAGTTPMGNDTAHVLGGQDAFITKWDTAGNVIWVETAGGEPGPFDVDDDAGKLIQYSPTTEGVVVAGRYTGYNSQFGPYTLSGSSQSEYIFVAAYSASGVCEWVQSIEGGSALVTGMLIDPNGLVYVLGNNRTTWTTVEVMPVQMVPPGGYMAVFEPDGTLDTAMRTVSGGEMYDASWLNNDMVVCGRLGPNATLFGQPADGTAPYFDAFVARLAPDRSIQWIQRLSSDSAAQAFRCAVGPLGHIAVSGTFGHTLIAGADTVEAGANFQQHNYFLALYDTAGTLLWHREFLTTAFSDYVAARNLAFGPQGELYLTGNLDGPMVIGTDTVFPTTGRDMFVARFDTTGTMQALWRPGRTGNPQLWSTVLPTDHGVYVGGSYDSTMVLPTMTVPVSLTDYEDIFLARFDSISGFTGVQTFRGVEQHALHIYANPNNGLCTIDLPTTLRATDDLVLSIYDNTGQLVQRAPLQFSEQGLKLDIRAQAKGIYHVELGDGQQRYTGTIVFE